MRRLKTTKRRKPSRYKPTRPEVDNLEDNDLWMVGTDSETLPAEVTK